MSAGICGYLFNHELGSVMCLVSTDAMAFVRGIENSACSGSSLTTTFSWILDLVKMIAVKNAKLTYAIFCYVRRS